MNQLSPIASQALQYPFLNALTPVLENLKEFIGKPYTWYLTELTRQEDALLDMKESVIDPVRKFMSGPQRGIFDAAKEFVQTQETNFAYIEGDEASEVVVSLGATDCFKGNRMQEVKILLEKMQKRVTAQVESEKAKAKDAVAVLKDRLSGMTEFGVLNGEQQESIIRPFKEFDHAIENQTLIAVIRESLRRFEEISYQNQLSQVANWAQSDSNTEPGKTDDPATKSEPRIEYVPSRSVKVAFDKAWLADEADVDSYLKSMREALLNEIRKGKRIQV